jgi:hypothetical protein
LDALRLASGPIAASEIAAEVMRAKGAAQDDKAFKALVTERVLSILGKLAKRGEVVKSGTSRNAKWTTLHTLL